MYIKIKYFENCINVTKGTRKSCYARHFPDVYKMTKYVKLEKVLSILLSQKGYSKIPVVRSAGSAELVSVNTLTTSSRMSCS